MWSATAADMVTGKAKVTHLADQNQSQHQGIPAMSRNVAPISMILPGRW